MILGEKEFTAKSAYILIKLRFCYIAVTYKYIPKHTSSIKYPKNTLKVQYQNFKITFALDIPELLRKKKAKMGQNRYFKTKHRMFRTKNNASPKNVTPPLELMDVTFRRSD